eukprot:TRINITY_DN7994_c0_g1_i3.p4 TRINITY_DN7994_c0_g1~~TRINITY_DN7994_c0_g1_i3.p4  ORF type:complete len:240 (-),score=-13.00 TRINITY_DN7994_c0_g1_i3:740-1459(-)
MWAGVPSEPLCLHTQSLATAQNLVSLNNLSTKDMVCGYVVSTAKFSQEKIETSKGPIILLAQSLNSYQFNFSSLKNKIITYNLNQVSYSMTSILYKKATQEIPNFCLILEQIRPLNKVRNCKIHIMWGKKALFKKNIGTLPLLEMKVDLNSKKLPRETTRQLWYSITVIIILYLYLLNNQNQSKKLQKILFSHHSTKYHITSYSIIKIFHIIEIINNNNTLIFVTSARLQYNILQQLCK